MLPTRFELHRPDSIEAALALMQQYGDDAIYYAGGTEMLIAMKARVVRYGHVIDIKRIPGLRGVAELDDGSLMIGALSTHHQLANDPVIRRRLPGYAQLADNVANIRVRAAGTIGGNLCFAEPHADPPAMLCALGAQLILLGPGGDRSVPMESFIAGEFTTVRAPDELLVAIEIPPLPTGARAFYRAFGHLERPAAGVAALAMPAAADPSRDTPLRWRFWTGAVADHPLRLEALEAALDGLPARDVAATIERIAPGVAQQLDVHDDIHGSADYKRHLVAVLAGRAAEACLS
ncbi:MAG: xanthine dehydrogenase family protein subunit M [Burkholderiaceae bacterium]